MQSSGSQILVFLLSLGGLLKQIPGPHPQNLSFSRSWVGPTTSISWWYWSWWSTTLWELPHSRSSFYFFFFFLSKHRYWRLFKGEWLASGQKPKVLLCVCVCVCVRVCVCVDVCDSESERYLCHQKPSNYSSVLGRVMCFYLAKRSGLFINKL